jgi:integrase/recombinase XerD
MSATALRGVGFDPLRDSRHRDARAARECADWLSWLELENKAPRTLDDYERTVAVLLRMFPNLALAEITDGELVHVLKRFPAPSRRIRRAHLASFIGWAYRTGRIPRNPLDLVPRQKRNPRRHVEVFTEAERVLLEGLPAPDGPLFSILFLSGIRKGEARRLRARHIDFGRGKLVVYQGKGAKDRVVPLRGLSQVLSDWFFLDAVEPDDFLWYTRPGGGKISHAREIGEGSFHRWYVGCLERAGVEYRPRTKAEPGIHNPHVTRHTFAVDWLRAGGRLETLSMALGHESIKTTFDEYGGLTLADVALDMEIVQG